MDKMNETEVRRVALFTLKQATKRLAELAQYTGNANLQARLLRVHALLITAAEEMAALDDVILQVPSDERLGMRQEPDKPEVVRSEPRRLVRAHR